VPVVILVVMEPVDAKYDSGVLTLARPLALRPGEWVSLIVLRRPDSRRWDLDRLSNSGSAEDADLAEQGLDVWVDALEDEDRP
jgi:hypothetical protein